MSHGSAPCRPMGLARAPLLRGRGQRRTAVVRLRFVHAALADPASFPAVILLAQVERLIEPSTTPEPATELLFCDGRAREIRVARKALLGLDLAAAIAVGRHEGAAFDGCPRTARSHRRLRR